MSLDIGEAEVASGVAVRKFFVIEAKKLKNGRVKVVDMDLFLDGGKAKFIGSAMGITTLDATPGQDHRKTVGIMIPAGASLAFDQFDDRRAAEFAANHDQG